MSLWILIPLAYVLPVLFLGRPVAGAIAWTNIEDGAQPDEDDWFMGWGAVLLWPFVLPGFILFEFVVWAVFSAKWLTKALGHWRIGPERKALARGDAQREPLLPTRLNGRLGSK